MYLQVTFMPAPHLGPYTCVYSSPQRNLLGSKSPDAGRPCGQGRLLSQSPRPPMAISLFHCSITPTVRVSPSQQESSSIVLSCLQSHSPSAGSSSSSIGLSPFALTAPLQHSPRSAVTVPYCGSSSTGKVLLNYYGPHSILIPPSIIRVPNLWQ